MGIVNARLEAVVSLRVRGPSGVETNIEAIVDSGFTASLTLPEDLVIALNLLRQTGGIARLGDGSVRRYEVCAAEVEWDGIWRSIMVSILGDQPLVGMGLLADHKLTIDVVPGGLVEIVLVP